MAHSSFFGWLNSLRKSARAGRSRRSDKRTVSLSVCAGLPLHLEALEDRTLMALLPTSLVSFPTALGLGIDPQVVIDPIDARKIVVIAGRGTNAPGPNAITGLTGLFTRDGGQTWQQYATPANLVDPAVNPQTNPANLPTLFARTTASVAFDRAENFYIVESEQNATDSSGALVVTKYAFGPTLTTPQIVVNPLTNKNSVVLYRWFGQDPAVNPVIAVDNNLATFIDPSTGLVQTDTLATMIPDPYNVGKMIPKGVYVAWNVNYTNNPNPGGFISRVEVAASGDGGVSFTPETGVSADSFVLPATSPQIIFTQGTPVDPLANPPATPLVGGGQLGFVYSRPIILNNTIVPTIFINQSRPDGGVATAPVAGAYDAIGRLIRLPDAIQGINGAPDTPGVASATVNVNITDPNFTLNDLTVSLSITHPHDSELRIRLKAPDGTTIPLLFQHVDGFNAVLTNPFNAAGFGLTDVQDLGTVTGLDSNGNTIKTPVDTVFDQQAIRNIETPVGVQPYSAHFVPEGTLYGQPDLSSFNGLTAAQLNGTWTLLVSDVYNDRVNNPPPQQLNEWGLHFGSYIDTNGFGTNRFLNVNGQVVQTVPIAFAAPYPLLTAASGPSGISPAVSVALDNTLGSFSPYQGRLYVAYTAGGGSATDVFLITSDDAGLTWNAAVKVNDDTRTDGTEGTRPQFMPTVAVDQTTGTVVVTYYDARLDASLARVATSITSSIDGGQTFSPSTYLNTLKTAIDVATNQTVVIEPIPGNQTATTTTLGFGNTQGLAVSGGHVFSIFSSNLNTDGLPFRDNSAQLLTATVTIAAGPRIVQGDMGAVTADFITPQGTLPQKIVYNNTYTADHTRQFTAFRVTFDRPVDPTSFTGDDVTLQYRDTVTPVSMPGTLLTGAANFTITPIDLGANFGPGMLAGNNSATQFLVALKIPLSGVGTYSYSVGPLINDRIRTPITGTTGGTTATTFFSAAPNLRVPPSGTGGSGVPAQDTTSSTINVAGLVNQITKVVVNVSIPHTFSMDLVISLIAPDGTVVQLANNEGGGNANVYQNTTFDDAANNPINLASTPFTLVNPETPLRVLNGMLAGPGGVANGPWTLKVTDTSAQDIGTLKNWSLTISTGTPITITNPGNQMDQNTNGITAEAGPDPGTYDAFSVPRPLNGVPFQANYDQDTLPLIIPGPHVVLTSLPSTPVTFDAQGNPTVKVQTDNLVLNNSANAIDVTFDRVMDATTFTPAAILRMVGPIGAVSGPFSVTPLDAAGNLAPAATTARTFRIGFPTQVLNGSYAITVGPSAKDVLGHNVDTNLNAGLAVLRGTDPVTSTLVPIVAASGNVNLTLPPTGKPIESDIIVNDSFPLAYITVQVNINMGYDPDLSAVLVAPDGTRVRLFTNVGGFGLSGPVNFTNTTLDDAASAPVELAPAPLDGTFNPQESLLNALLNKQVSGKWKLLITNTTATPPSGFGPQTGTLLNWTLNFKKPVPGTGLGEAIADQFTPTFRIFNQDVSGAQSHNEWTPVGPASISSGLNAGPVTAIAVDPSDASGNTVYIASGGGGVWKTNNFLTTDPQGPSYIPLTDLGPIHSLNIGSIAVFARNNDPNQSIIFVGTGEGDRATPGVGFLRSTDGGKTWTILDSTGGNFDAAGNPLPINSLLRDHGFVGTSVFKVIVDPTAQVNGQVVVYAAVSGVNGGIWRSNDGGNTWKNIQAGDATDVALSAGSKGANGNLSVLFGAIRGSGVYYTTSAATTNNMSLRSGGAGVTNRFVEGSTQQIPVGNDTAAPGQGRIALAVPALTNNPARDAIYQGFVYALDSVGGLYLSKDFGLNWTPVHLPVLPPPVLPLVAIPTNNELLGDYSPLDNTKFGKANINMDLVIDPNNPNIVYIGGSIDTNPTGLIRVDTSALSDAYALSAYDNSNNDGGQQQFATVGDVTLFAPGGRYGILDLTKTPPTVRSAYFNLLRDPDHPFLIPSSFQFRNVSSFTNLGQDATWLDVDTQALLGGTAAKHSTGAHKAVALTDPLTGHTRFIFGDDNGVFSGVDLGNGKLDAGIGTMRSATGSRNGNLQIAQFYYGAAQPSVLAADLAGALFYGMGQDNGFPSSSNDILTTGNLNWNLNLKPNGSRPPILVTHGDGTGVAVDQTGGGTAYFYKWPFDGAEPLKSDFFLVQKAGGLEVSKITGLLQGSDNPGQDIGEWPLEAQTYGFLVNGNFTVNPIDPTAGVISSTNGTIFRTSGPSTGLLAINQRWFPIGNPADLDGSYAAALAFGAPNPSSLGNLDDFIYAGTTQGSVFVVFNGGGVGTAWTRINGTGAGALDGSAIQKIVTDPKHGSHDLYAVTLQGVYFMADSSAATPQWVNVTGNLFSPTFFRPVFGDVNNPAPALVSFSPSQPNAVLTSLVADWRFAIPDDPANPTGPTHPVLYVGSEGGVFRSIDKGATWNFFPHRIGDGSAFDATEEGGYLANTRITDLNLVLGNINPATGLPDQTTGLNVLAASTFGRGNFAIRLNNADVEQFNLNHISGPAVTALTNPAPSPVGIKSLQVTFSTAVDPVTFTPAKIIYLTDPTGKAIAVTSVTDVSTGTPKPHNLYEIDFPIQAAAGFYHISFGPRLSNFEGDLMNQNANNVNGENPGDIYTARFLYQPNGNAAPILPSNTATFPAINEDDATNQGTDLMTWVATLGITDSDPGAVQGLAISAVDNTKGTWQYSQNGGTTWVNITGVSPTRALLLEAVANNRLRFVPTGDFVGFSTFNFQAWDLTSGLNQPYGTDGGFADASQNGGTTAFSAITATATLQVRFVNDIPTFTKGPDQAPLENGGGQSVQTVTNWAKNISAGPPNEVTQRVQFIITGDDNPGLFSQTPQVSPTGTLTYQLNQYALGTANITLVLMDDGGTANGGIDTSTTASFKIVITPVNQAPSFSVGPDQTPLENGGGQAPFVVTPWATNVSPGPLGFPGETVTFIIKGNDNPTLFSATGAPAVSPNGTLTYQLAQYAVGTANIALVVMDDGGTANGGVDTSAAQTFKIVITPVNQPPTFTVGPDQTTLESKTPAAQTVFPWAKNISAGPPNEAGQKVHFVITGDDNPGLFSVLPAVANDGTLTYKAAVLNSGTATITVVAVDDGATGTPNGDNNTSAPQTFKINVTLVNQPPFFTGGPDETVLDNGGAEALQSFANWATNISPGVNQSNLKVHFNVTNDNNTLFATQPTISPTGTLTFLPAQYAIGSATVTAFIQNNGGTANGGVDTFGPRTFHINVTPVNQPPTFTVGPDQTVLEARNPSTQTVPNWAKNIAAGPANESSQQVHFVVTANSNPNLFSVQPTVGPTGTLTYQAAGLAVGTASITLTLVDDGATGTPNGDNNTSAPQTFKINVSLVNQPPSFTPGGNEVTTVYDPLQVLPGWAANISAGPPNQGGQTVSFIVSNDKPSLFLVQPNITPDGTLSFQPGATPGVANVTLFVKNTGGTSNGGQDTFGPYNFTITINPVVSVGSADGLWVSQAFRDLLGREARPSEVAYWTGQLESTLTRFVAAQQMTHSDEYLTDYITGLYKSYLNRALDTNGKFFYLGLFHRGFTAEQVKAQIFQSDEYVQKNGGNNFGFLTGVYHDALGVPLDDAGRNFWGTKLAKGESPNDVALEILRTPAAESRVVQAGYPLFLGRPADAGATFWTNAIIAGTPDQDFYSSLLASAEYGLKVTANNYDSQQDTRWLHQAFLDALGRPIDASGLGFYITQIRVGARRFDIAQSIVGSTEFRIKLIQGVATNYVGHPLDATGLNNFVLQLGQGVPVEEVKAQILQSDEYFTLQQKNGGGNLGYLVGVFNDVLGRNLDDASRVLYGTKLASGESRHDVALEVLKSPAGLGRVVQFAYPQFLVRPAADGDITFWTSMLQTSLTDLAFYAKLLGSHEYYVNA